MAFALQMSDGNTAVDTVRSAYNGAYRIDVGNPFTFGERGGNGGNGVLLGFNNCYGNTGINHYDYPVLEDNGNVSTKFFVYGHGGNGGTDEGRDKDPTTKSFGCGESSDYKFKSWVKTGAGGHGEGDTGAEVYAAADGFVAAR